MKKSEPIYVNPIGEKFFNSEEKVWVINFFPISSNAVYYTYVGRLNGKMGFKTKKSLFQYLADNEKISCDICGEEILPTTSDISTITINTSTVIDNIDVCTNKYEHICDKCITVVSEWLKKLSSTK